MNESNYQNYTDHCRDNSCGYKIKENPFSDLAGHAQF